MVKYELADYCDNLIMLKQRKYLSLVASFNTVASIRLEIYTFLIKASHG